MATIPQATEYHAPKHPPPKMQMARYDLRSKLPPTDPQFWVLLQTKQSSERQKEVAKALAKWWDEEKKSLPKDFIRQERLSKIFDGFEKVSLKYTDVGAADIEGRQGVYLLLARHYGVSPDVFQKAWIDDTTPIPVNLPGELAAEGVAA